MLNIDITNFLNSNKEGIYDEQYDLTSESYFIVRNLPNNDKFLFFEINNPIILRLNIPNLVSVMDLDLKYQKPEYDNRYGEIELSGWQNLIRTENFEIILSKQYDYIVHCDEDSYLNDLELERKLVLKKEDSKLDIISHYSSSKSSFSLVITKNKFFNNDDNLNAYLDLFYSELKNNNAACSTWYKPNALLTKTAASVKPSCNKPYQISIHHSSKKELVHFYRVRKDRFIYNLLVNAAYTILNFQPTSKGMFLTTFTSNWLYQRYQIKAPYVDTRLNETFTNTLKDIKELTGEFIEYDIFKNYAIFLQENIDKVHKSQNGIFFPDYFSLNEGEITHTSLNHQLGIANYFLMVYKQTNDKSLLTVFDKILNFVIDTKASWVNDENGDLFYEANTDINGCLVFQGKDYVFVTLSDLLFLLKNYFETFNKLIPEIIYLIDKKLNFLVKNGFDPELSTLIASGEGDNDKKQIVRFLKELDLYYLLELSRKKESSYLDTINSLIDIDLTKELPSAYIIYLKARQSVQIGHKNRADFFYRLNHVLHSSSIPYTAKIGKNSIFAYGGIGVIVHSAAVIGERCNIGSGVVIGGDYNEIPNIGHDVFVSTGAKILGNVKIGDGAVIGANAIVKKDVLPFTVVGGVPAKVLGKITNENFKKYSGFYWCKNDIDKSKIFCNWYISRKKMDLV